MKRTEKTVWRSLLSRRGISMFLFSVLFSLCAFSQGIVVKGVVQETSGEGIPGVSVLEKGTTNGGITNLDGEYTLTVSGENSVLVFSYIGFSTKEETVRQRRTIHVTLKEDAELLDEVVVVGYGVQKKATVTGSVASVKGGDLKASGVANVTNMLAGQLPGVIATNRTGEPGADYSTILIRGKGSLNENSPLFVIDGIANRTGLERLNPNDIESINVLKDASASIYGAQAANGVILITTKRGTASRPTINYNGNYSISQFTRTPDLLNAYEYMTYADEISRYKNQTPVFENIKEGYLDGTIDRNRWGDTDWMKTTFRKNAPQTRHSLSASGGSEKVKFYISGDYLYQEPNYRNTDYNFKTTQLRSNVDAQITNNLKVGVDLALRREKRHNGVASTATMFWEAFQTYPYLYDYYPNGLPGPGLSKGNNLALLASGKETGYDRVEDLFLDTKMSFQLDLPWITKGLSLSGYGAIDRRYRNQKYFMDVWDTYTYNGDTGEYIKRTGNINDSHIELTQKHRNDRSKTYHMKLNYDRTFGDHRVGAFVAYEQSQFYSDDFWAWRGYFLSNKPDFLDFGGDKDKTNGGKAFHTSRQNYFGRLNYGYKERYLFEFTLRHDGSMNFATGHRWGTFPGVSVGWRISEENFMQSATFVNDLKLRASWGKLGNDVTLDEDKKKVYFQYISTYNLDKNSLPTILGENPSASYGFAPGRIGNPYITWEKVDSRNIAVDGILWDGLLSFTAEYFYQIRKDILTPKQASIPNYTGLKLPHQNIGEVSNQGFELMLNHRNKIGNVTYNIGGNLTFTKNKIKYFDEAANIPEWQRVTGGSMGRWLMYKTDGIYQTREEIDNSVHMRNAQPGDIKYVNVDGDEAITDNDRVRSKYSNTPELVYGINMSAEWKGLSFSMLWTGQGRVQQMVVPYSFNIHKKYYNNRWISAAETPDSKYPRAFDHQDYNNTRWSDFWLYDASFLRLKNVEIGYTLPKQWSEYAKLQNVRLYVAGNNLFTIDKIKFQDPESEATAWGQYYPQARTYTVGVNLTF